MSPEVEAKYKESLRTLLATRGLPLLPPGQRSAYMSVDYQKARHILPWNNTEEPCKWNIPPGTVVREEERYEFAGTDCSSDFKTSIVATGISCSCGLLTNEEIRVDATFSEVLEQVIGGPAEREETL